MIIGIGNTIPEITNLPGQRDEGVSLTISYPSSAFCTSASDPSPTVSGNVGAGIFSAGVGLQFLDTGSNTGSSTGVVDISNTVTGTYTITYTDTDNALATTPLEVVLSDNATFSYSASSYDPSASNPTPTTVLAGGTFTAAPSGLVFVDTTTGEINLSTSTIGSYTITYNTSPVGNLCPSTSTQPIAIAVAGLAQIDNLNSMSFDGSSDFINNGTGVGNALGSSATNFSISGWFKTVVSPIPADDGMFAFGNGPTSSVADAPFFIRQNTYNRLFVESRTASGITGRIGFLFDVRPLSWRHYCIVYDGTQTDKLDRIKCYVNGISLTQTGNYGTIPTSINLTNKTNFIGAGITNQYYNGSIDELAVFNYSLTEAEILSIYNATAVVDGVNKTADLSQLTTPPIAWYRM